MPKKAVRSTKRAKRRPVKKSFLEKLFTFPKLVVFGVIVLSTLTVYQITLSSNQVKGVATLSDDITLITESEAKDLVQSTATNGYTVHQIRVFEDNKKTDGKFDIYKEECLNKDVTIYVDNGKKVREFPGIWGCTDLIRIKTKARELTVGIKSVSGYKISGLTYRDQNHPNDTTRMGISKIKVKGFPTYSQYYTVIDFGFKKK